MSVGVWAVLCTAGKGQCRAVCGYLCGPGLSRRAPLFAVDPTLHHAIETGHYIALRVSPAATNYYHLPGTDVSISYDEALKSFPTRYRKPVRVLVAIFLVHSWYVASRSTR